mgnify:CR=1 FL=1
MTEDIAGWGTLVPQTKSRRMCDTRCWLATKMRCECICGGDNHGRVATGVPVRRQYLQDKLPPKASSTEPDRPVRQDRLGNVLSAAEIEALSRGLRGRLVDAVWRLLGRFIR